MLKFKSHVSTLADKWLGKLACFLTRFAKFPKSVTPVCEDHAVVYGLKMRHGKQKSDFRMGHAVSQVRFEYWSNRRHCLFQQTKTQNTGWRLISTSLFKFYFSLVRQWVCSKKRYNIVNWGHTDYKVYCQQRRTNTEQHRQSVTKQQILTKPTRTCWKILCMTGMDNDLIYQHSFRDLVFAFDETFAHASHTQYLRVVYRKSVQLWTSKQDF